MKKFIFVAGLAFAVSAFAEPEVKTVCRDKINQKGELVKDKSGKPVQECKKVKVHKKLEGTKVPEKK